MADFPDIRIMLEIYPRNISPMPVVNVPAGLDGDHIGLPLDGHCLWRLDAAARVRRITAAIMDRNKCDSNWSDPVAAHEAGRIWMVWIQEEIADHSVKWI